MNQNTPAGFGIQSNIMDLIPLHQMEQFDPIRRNPMRWNSIQWQRENNPLQRCYVNDPAILKSIGIVLNPMAKRFRSCCCCCCCRCCRRIEGINRVVAQQPNIMIWYSKLKKQNVDIMDLPSLPPSFFFNTSAGGGGRGVGIGMGLNVHVGWINWEEIPWEGSLNRVQRGWRGSLENPEDP